MELKTLSNTLYTICKNFFNFKEARRMKSKTQEKDIPYKLKLKESMTGYTYIRQNVHISKICQKRQNSII